MGRDSGGTHTGTQEEDGNVGGKTKGTQAIGKEKTGERTGRKAPLLLE